MQFNSHWIMLFMSLIIAMAAIAMILSIRSTTMGQRRLDKLKKTNYQDSIKH